jgi:hypothetical protein
MKHSTPMKHPCKASRRTSAKTQGVKCRGVKVVNGVVGGPVNSPEPGAKGAGKKAYPK